MSAAPCRDCFGGSVHPGTPTGTISTIHGLPTYIASPPDGVAPKGIVVFIPDAFGWDFPNNRLLSDNYAKNGHFLVYLPDFMNGRSMPFELVDLMEEKIKKPASWFTTIFYKPFYIAKVMIMVVPWLWSCRVSVCKPRIFNFFKALRTSPPPFPTSDLKIGAAGFCWGGLYTILLAQDAPSSRVIRHSSQISSPALQPLIDCGFTAHPSMVTVPKDIEPVSIPLSVTVGNEDMAMKGPLIAQMKEILEKKKDDHEVNILPGAKHGFAIRTDPKDQYQMECADKAEVQAIDWFSRWFA